MNEKLLLEEILGHTTLQLVLLLVILCICICLCCGIDTDNQQYRDHCDVEKRTGREKTKPIVINDGDTVTEEDVFKWIEQEEYSSDEIIIPESGFGYKGHSKNLTDKARKSRAEGRTLFYVADNKKVYLSDKERHNGIKEHAEINFINKANLRRVYNINITNSPCHNCAAALIEHFDEDYPKPTIYIGQIWRLYNTQDDNGLKEMMIQKFQLKVWDKLHDMMYPAGDTTTADYLKRLESEL